MSLLLAWAWKSLGVALLCLPGFWLGRRLPAAQRCGLLRACFWATALLPLAGLLAKAWRVYVPLPLSGAALYGTSAAPTSASWGIGETVAAVWAVGAAIGLVRLAADFRRLKRSLVDQPLQAADYESADLPVFVSGAADVTGPFTLGLFRPIVVLPTDSEGWSAEKRLAVVRHEAAHVGRRDWAHTFAMRVVAALLWPNPALHRLAALADDAAEEACDESVLASDVAPAVYAALLVELTRQRTRKASLAVVSMARASTLERRVRAILASRGDRRWVRPAGFRVAIAALWLLASLLAVGRVYPDLEPLMARGGVRGGDGTTLSTSWVSNGREHSIEVQGPATIVENGPGHAPTVFRE